MSIFKDYNIDSIIEEYRSKGFNLEQLTQIQTALYDDYCIEHINLFAKIDYSGETMEKIRILISQNLSQEEFKQKIN